MRTGYRRIRSALAGHGLGGLAPVRHLNALLERLLERGVVEVHGHRMFLDRDDALNLRSGTWEPYETEVLTGLARPGSIVLDLGAFIGYYTLLFARLVGRDGLVIAFEPEPKNFRILRRNVVMNNYHARLIAKAVDREPGTRRLFLSTENVADHRLYDSADGRHSIEVPAVRIDDELSGLERVDLIKMDIQGSEPAAIEGMRGLLRRSPGVVMLTEFWPIGLERFGVHPRAYLHMLRDLGFELREADERTHTLVPIDPETFDVHSLAARRPPERDHTNILCARTGVLATTASPARPSGRRRP